VWAAGFISLGIFLFAAWMLNTFVLMLAPIAMIGLVGYAYTKRFTWFCHIWLGIVDGAAAAGAWAAVTGDLASPIPWLLWAAVTVWIAGFDLIYACQDVRSTAKKACTASPPASASPRPCVWLRFSTCSLCCCWRLQDYWRAWAGSTGWG
jgi:4-hydroxybenzoate polyprenyltransferase